MNIPQEGYSHYVDFFVMNTVNITRIFAKNFDNIVKKVISPVFYPFGNAIQNGPILLPTYPLTCKKSYYVKSESNPIRTYFKKNLKHNINLEGPPSVFILFLGVPKLRSMYI